MDATPSLTTVDDLRAWAARVSAAQAGRSQPPRYLLVEGQNWLGQRGVFLECRAKYGQDWQTLAPALAKPLLARWPTTRAGGRAHLSAMGVLRLVAGEQVAAAAAVDAMAMVRARDAERARLDRLTELLEAAFSSGDHEADDRARTRWGHSPRPEFGGRTAFAAVAAEQAALDVVRPLLEQLARDREAAEAQGWSVEPDPEALPQLPAWAHAGYLRLHATLKGYVHEGGQLVAIVTLVGREEWHPERSEIAWVGDDPTAADRLAAAATAYEVRVRPPDVRQHRPLAPAAAAAFFLWELAARGVRDARAAAGRAPAAGASGP